MVRNAASAVGLGGLAAREAVLSVDHGVELDAIRGACGFEIHSLEERTGRRRPPRAEDMERLAAAHRDTLQKLFADGRNWIVVCPFASPIAASFASGDRTALLTIPWEHGRDVARKKGLQQLLRQVGLPILPGRWLSPRSERYADLKRELGTPFVLQTDRGIAGLGTAVVDGEATWERAAPRFKDELVWAAPHVGRLSLNVNAAVLEPGVLVSRPSIQVVSEERLGAAPGAYCGNDFTAVDSLAGTLTADVADQTLRLGEALHRRGYRGPCGLDFVVHDESRRAYAVDLNTRWQGSSILQTHAEDRVGRLPFCLAELAGRLGLLDRRDVDALRSTYLAPLEGSQVVFHVPSEFVVGTDTAPGRHVGGVAVDAGAVRLSSLDGPDDALVFCGVPPAGFRLAPDSFAFRLARLGPAVDESARLTEDVANLVQDVVDKMNLTSVGDAARSGER